MNHRDFVKLKTSSTISAIQYSYSKSTNLLSIRIHEFNISQADPHSSTSHGFLSLAYFMWTELFTHQLAKCNCR